MRGYAGGYGGARSIDREGVGSAVWVGVFEDHLGEVERLGKVGGYGNTDEAAGRSVVSSGDNESVGDNRTLYA